MSKRYVPFVTGVAAGGVSFGLLSAGTWWSFTLATLTTAYAIFSIKTALTATDRQIEALTGDRPMADYDVSESAVRVIRQPNAGQQSTTRGAANHPTVSRTSPPIPVMPEVPIARSPSDLCPTCFEFHEPDEKACRYCGADLTPPECSSEFAATQGPKREQIPNQQSTQRTPLRTFTRKAPYTDVVIETLNEALDIDIKSEAVFKGLPISNLEALITVFWMVERSLHCLPDSKREKAGSHMLDAMLDFLRDDYSEGEIKSLVIPAFMKRTAEYSSLFSLHAGDEPRGALLRTSARIVENVFGEHEADLSRTMTVMLLWLQPIFELGSGVKSLDDDRRIAW